MYILAQRTKSKRTYYAEWHISESYQVQVAFMRSNPITLTEQWVCVKAAETQQKNLTDQHMTAVNSCAVCRLKEDKEEEMGMFSCCFVPV